MAYLRSNLLIFELDCNGYRTGYFKNKWYSQKANFKVKLGSYDGGWYTEYNGTIFMTISQTSKEKVGFSIRNGKNMTDLNC